MYLKKCVHLAETDVIDHRLKDLAKPVKKKNRHAMISCMRSLPNRDLSSEEALRLLMIWPEYTQVAVKTAIAAKQLKWVGSDKVTGVKEYKKLLKKEQDEYRELFAATLGILDELLEEN